MTATKLGFCMIRNGKRVPASMIPPGRQNEEGRSLKFSATRFLESSPAQGSGSGCPSSTVRKGKYRPEKSGLPSGVRGVDPEGALCDSTIPAKNVRSSPTEPKEGKS